MNENATVEFVNKICEMDRAGQEPKIIEIDGIKYTDCRRLEKIDTHISPNYLTVHSLYGLTQIIKEERSKYSYPLFDYAMLILWNNLNVSQLNDEFLTFTKSNIVEFLKTTLDVSLSWFTGLSIASIIELLFKAYDNLKKFIIAIK